MSHIHATGEGGAMRVADILRERIITGQLRSGEQLSEEKLALDLGASRNTLREGFRLLVRERLLIHQLNRGVHVRTLGVVDVIDLYRMRRIVETGALLNAGYPIQQPLALQEMQVAVEEAKESASVDDWLAVGKANIEFHAALVGLAGSSRLRSAMVQVLAEQRLSFGVMSDLRAFHEPYAGDNERMVVAVRENRLNDALAILLNYLNVAEQQLLTAFGSHD
jgi:DNA-binding GntR family transcriptional regulator